MCHPIRSNSQQQTPCTAKTLDCKQRQRLAIRVISDEESITKIAEEANVSRKFLYQQADKAEQALDDAFANKKSDDSDVLFYFPVTKAWLRQFILALTLICHSSFRGVIELLRDLFNVKVSIGTVHNVIADAAEKARCLNQREDLSAIDYGAHDEIFQAGKPVLVGIDVFSTYCYLLSPQDQRDGDTWALLLWDLQERGFNPKAIIADAGSGLRRGQKLALPEIPCRGDIFHALRDFCREASYFENRAFDAMTACHKLERQLAQHRRNCGSSDRGLSAKLREARTVENKAIALADNIALLAKWLRQDIFPVAGLSYQERIELFDFVLAELQRLEALRPQRITPLRKMLSNQKISLLAFAADLDDDLQALADEFEVPLAVVRRLLQMQAIDPASRKRWSEETLLRAQLRGRFHHLSEAVREIAEQTVRASSLVENYNSRLRNYFFLRRHLGPEYLELLRFFLNHRRYFRSERPERAGKSSAELLTGESHQIWLELLGYKPFTRS